MKNPVNKCCSSFTSNSTAVGKAILLRKETKTSFQLPCLGGSPAAEVQIIYAGWVENPVMQASKAFCFI